MRQKSELHGQEAFESVFFLSSPAAETRSRRREAGGANASQPVDFKVKRQRRFQEGKNKIWGGGSTVKLSSQPQMQYENSCMHLMTVTIYNFAKDSNTLHVYADWLHVAFLFYFFMFRPLLSFHVFLLCFSHQQLNLKSRDTRTFVAVSPRNFTSETGKENKQKKKKKAWDFLKKKMGFQKCVRLHGENRAMPQLEVCKRSTYIHNTERGVT